MTANTHFGAPHKAVFPENWPGSETPRLGQPHLILPQVLERPPAPPSAAEAIPSTRSRREDLDLRTLACLMRRQAGFIAVLAGLLLAAMVPPIMSMERTFSAQLRLLIGHPEVVALALPETPMAAPLDLATEIERLQAQSNAQQVIDDLDLAQRPEFNPPQKPSLVQALTGALRRLGGGEATSEPGVEPEWDPVVANFYGGLSIRRSGSSNVVEIGFTSRDPQLVAQVPNHLVEVYLAQRRSQAAFEVARARHWLREQVETQLARVQDMDGVATLFQSQTGQDLAASRLELTARITTLTDHLADLAQTRVDYAGALAELDAGTITSAAIDAFASPLLLELGRDLQVRQHELATLRQTFGENHEDVVSHRAAVAETQEALLAEARRLASALRLRVAALDAEHAEALTALAEARTATLGIDAREAEHEAMVRDLDRERTTLASLEEQIRRLDSEAGLPIAEAEILSPAVAPRWPDGRSRKFYLAAAVVAALCLATTAAFVRELLDATVRSQQQFWGLPRVVTAGLIPAAPGRLRTAVPERLRREPDGLFADAVRWLVLSLQQPGPAPSSGTMPRSLLITSALPGNGASTVAVALATMLAASGRPVLLVDADLRHGTLHRQFGGQTGPGLAELSCGQATLAEVIQVDPASGVEYVARGAHPQRSVPDPMALAAVLQLGRESGRIVIFDGSPVLATAEAARLATLTEQCLLVTRWGGTPLRMADLAIDRLLAHSSRDVAVVVSQVDPRRHARYSFADSDLYAPALRRYRSVPA